MLAWSVMARYIPSMRRLRLILFVCLSLVIPLQGLAQFTQLQAPCPMKQGMDNPTADTGSLHDCCNDAETAAKTGQPCKTAQPCSTSGQFMPFSAPEDWYQPPADAVRYPHLADSLFPYDPADLWRPPTQL